MKNNSLHFSKNKLAALCACALSLNSYAETAEDDVEQHNNDIESISVVGHKLTELSAGNNGGALGNKTLLETPFSVDVISLEDMEIRQVNTLDSLFSREASVSVDGSAYSTFGSTIRVRGLPLDYTNSFKINGMSINNFSGELPYEAFEQVTLLKGASGFMYGMAAPGGVVNYVTKKAKEDQLIVDFGLRSDSVFSGHIDASTRIGEDDEYGIRVNLVKEEGDTYLENGTIDRETASLAFDAQLTDSLYWTVDVIYSDRLTENSWTTMSNNLDSSESLPDTVSGTRSIAPEGTFDDYKNIVALTSLNWDIDETWSVRFEYDYSKNETRWVKTLAYLESSTGDIDIALYDQYFDVNYDQVQVQANGEFDTGSISHSLLVGASYQKSTTYRNDPNRKVTWGYGTDNLYDPVDLPAYNSTLEDNLSLAWTDKQESFYVSDFISLTDEWEVLLGIRGTQIEHTPSEYFSSYQAYNEDSAVTPTAALMYKPDTNTTYYVSYVESFEGTTSYVGETYANADELLPPLESLQYELGVKTAGDGWSMTSALFRIERGATLVTDDNYLIQDGLSIYQGFEFSAAWEVTDNLSLYGDLMLLDATYDKTNSAVEGNDVAGTPNEQFTIQTNYDFDAIPGLAVNLGAKHFGKTTLDSNNNWELPAYNLFYAGASYNTTLYDKSLTIIGSVDNLFDKEFWAVGDAYGALRIGEPRTFAVKVKMSI
ncbi:TonB-dependent siderophore receptor [Shewanella saliphila]|uniref:Ferric siderophore receptor n=1 Tax=Shewanella saliphila TaxID=2282698 RepID=A0ABQ2Q8K3_9GAMM|nr:TonB-dependent siderophore receptor [Shewanella saliphila]MCL1102437.1 TonB-dependent siderophore receptor [Shewanella saliphila]GGP56319.1 ferric siderophore receptor [Shewanella saliphila]